MIHLASFQNHLRLWLHRSIWQPTEKSATQQFQAAAWDRRFGPLATLPVRCLQRAELVDVANHFLACYEHEQTQLATFHLPRI